MESKTFVKLLRKVVREEVQSVVRKELKTALNEQKTNHNKVMNHGLDLHKIAEKDIKNPFESQKLEQPPIRDKPLQVEVLEQSP